MYDIYIYISCAYSTYSLYCLWNAVDLCGSLGSNKVVFAFFPLPWNQCSLLSCDLAQGKPLTSTTAALLWWNFQCVYKHRSLMFNRLDGAFERWKGNIPIRNKAQTDGIQIQYSQFQSRRPQTNAGKLSVYQPRQAPMAGCFMFFQKLRCLNVWAYLRIGRKLVKISRDWL